LDDIALSVDTSVDGDDSETDEAEPGEVHKFDEDKDTAHHPSHFPADQIRNMEAGNAETGNERHGDGLDLVVSPRSEVGAKKPVKFRAYAGGVLALST